MKTCLATLFFIIIHQMGFAQVDKTALALEMKKIDEYVTAINKRHLKKIEVRPNNGLMGDNNYFERIIYIDSVSLDTLKIEQNFKPPGTTSIYFKDANEIYIYKSGDANREQKTYLRKDTVLYTNIKPEKILSITYDVSGGEKTGYLERLTISKENLIYERNGRKITKRNTEAKWNELIGKVELRNFDLVQDGFNARMVDGISTIISIQTDKVTHFLTVGRGIFYQKIESFVKELKSQIGSFENQY